jgi:foldase protein PrsA
MGEWNHTSAAKSNSGTKKKTWTMVAAGTAILLLAAGVMLQVSRPQPAYPEDGSPAGKSQQAAKTGSGEQAPKKTVARVGKDQITYDELAAECVRRFGEEILDNLINRKIIQQACDAQGIEISEAEVRKEIKKTSADFGLDEKQYLQMLEAERKITPTQYARDIVWPMLALRKLAGDEVKVTKKDLDEAFIRHYGPRVKARAIVLDHPRRAREVWEKVQKNPDNFERLAQEHSVDPSSKALGGLVPPIPRFGGSKELEDAAFKLKEGEISPVIQVALNHFIILKCEGQTDPTVKKIEEVQSILMKELKEEKVQQAVAVVFDKIKKDARVDNYVTGVSSGGERNKSGTKTAAGTGAIKQTSATAPRLGANRVADDGSPAAATRVPSAKSGARPSTGNAPGRSSVDQ